MMKSVTPFSMRIGWQNDRKQKVCVCALFAVILMGIAVFAPFLCPWDPNGQDYAAALQAPNRLHLLGTDAYGRDMLSRSIMGAHVSILSAGIVVILSTSIGMSIGTHCATCHAFGRCLLGFSAACVCLGCNRCVSWWHRDRNVGTIGKQLA